MSASPPLIVVDAANVMGSRPDGWWRDRGAAAGRLLSELSAEASEDRELALVLEGDARAGVAEGWSDGIRVVHASGSGDDAIVDLVATAAQEDQHRLVTVVTADRGLRQRVEALGARTHGPSWLRRE
jgi:hypothetical protein